MALKLRKYWRNYLRGLVKFWGWWRFPKRWNLDTFRRACRDIDGLSEETRAEIREYQRLRVGLEGPPTEAELERREQMNAGVYDTPYFSIRYEDHRTITRGITPYFLGDLAKAPFNELSALYKIFPDDRLLLITIAARCGSDWPETKEELDRERTILTREADED